MALDITKAFETINLAFILHKMAMLNDEMQ